jgi:predicted acylesterase/phospholipase RssA
MNPSVFPELQSFTTLSLAAGGNRCFWQAGMLSILRKEIELGFRRVAGTSAGAVIGAAYLVNRMEVAVDACEGLFKPNPSNWYGHSNAWFAHEIIYPRWVDAIVTSPAFDTLRQSGVSLLAGVAIIPRFMPRSLGVTVGTCGYLMDKFVNKSLHPRWPRWLGFEMIHHSVNDATSRDSAAHMLVCASAAPPLISARTLNNRAALDGGYADNAPRLTPINSDDQHLVMLTRFYPDRPSRFHHEGRWYLQPSQRVPVSTFDCTHRATVRDAFSLGVKDALALLSKR